MITRSREKKKKPGRSADELFLGRTRRLIKVLFTLVIITALPLGIDQYIHDIHNQNVIFHRVEDVPVKTAGLVLGAAVYSSGPSPVLADRLDSAIQLYRNGRIKKILVSGDHGKPYYDETNTMARYISERGVRLDDIFLDHAGFRTLDSVYRARHIFEVKDCTIITQEFHLPRAIYLARSLGIDAVGFPANRRVYRDRLWNRFREFFARAAAWLDINILHTRPKFMGKKIPITGSGLASRDDKHKKPSTTKGGLSNKK